MASCPKISRRNVNAFSTSVSPSVIQDVAPFPLHVSPTSVNPINNDQQYPPPRQNQLLLGCFLNYGPKQIPLSAFIDSGADSSFMDLSFAQRIQVPLIELSTPISLEVAHGEAVGLIRFRTVPLQLHIGDHIETISFFVTALAHDVLLGFTWMEKHDPKIVWSKNLVTFDSSFCHSNAHPIPPKY